MIFNPIVVKSGGQEAPTIEVNSSGLITARAGELATTKQLTTQRGTTITPGTGQKTAVASGRYTTGSVYVAGSPNLVASNIRSGVNIFGVTGTYTGGRVYLAQQDLGVYHEDGDSYSIVIAQSEMHPRSVGFIAEEIDGFGRRLTALRSSENVWMCERSASVGESVDLFVLEYDDARGENVLRWNLNDGGNYPPFKSWRVLELIPSQ